VPPLPESILITLERESAREFFWSEPVRDGEDLSVLWKVVTRAVMSPTARAKRRAHRRERYLCHRAEHLANCRVYYYRNRDTIRKRQHEYYLRRKHLTSNA
jgi:hypothetical protein